MFKRRLRRKDHAGSARAERLVVALQEIPLPAWRDAALAAFRDPTTSIAVAALTLVLPSASPIRRWHLHDDLTTALHRLETREAIGLVRTRKEMSEMREATQRAVDALLCDDCLDPAHAPALAGPFLALTSPRLMDSTVGALGAVRDSSEPMGKVPPD